MIKTIKAKVLAFGGTVAALVALGVTPAQAAALDAINASSTASDFGTAMILDAKDQIFGVLGKLALFSLGIAVIYFAYRWVMSHAKGKR